MIGAADRFDDFADTHVAAFAQKFPSLKKDKYRRNRKNGEMRCNLGGFGDIDALYDKSGEFGHYRIAQFGFEGMADVASRGAEIEHHRVVVLEGVVDCFECLHKRIIMKFVRAYVEVTNVCGLSCSFCPPKSQPTVTMNPSFFESVLGQLRPYTDEVALHVMGDPMVLSNLGGYLDIAEHLGFKVMITTSGFYLDPGRRILLLHPAVRQVNVSLNSFNKNSVSRSFEEYLDPIMQLCDEKLAGRCDSFINLRLWNLDEAQSASEFNGKLFERLENHFGLDRGFIVSHISGGRQGIRLASKILLHFDRYFEWPNLNNRVVGDGYCHGLSGQIAILADGRVVPCCLDGEGVIDLGSLHVTNLDKILSSKRSTAIVEGFSGGIALEELCQKCSYKERFKKGDRHD